MGISVWGPNLLGQPSVHSVRNQCSQQRLKAGVSIFYRMAVLATRDNPYEID